MPTLVFWIDVDNTLLANDEIKKNLDEHIQVLLGPKLTAHFWDLYEQARHEKGVVDIPLALSRLREQTPATELDEQTYLHVHSLFDNYPFSRALYPYVLETLQYLRSLGLTIIVSDGDLYFQAEKIVNSFLAETVEGRVLLYVHKQEHLDDIMRLYPADHYVMIDDKPQILLEAKTSMGDNLTTVFVQQGKYATDQLPQPFQPDIIVPQIGELRNYSKDQFLHASSTKPGK